MVIGIFILFIQNCDTTVYLSIIDLDVISLITHWGFFCKPEYISFIIFICVKYADVRKAFV